MKNWAKLMVTESALLFEFALYQVETILIRGAVLISEKEETNAFGEHFHIEEIALFGNERAMVSRAIFKGLILRYKFGLPSCSMSLTYFDTQQDTLDQWYQVERLRVALQIGVHDSDDWENISLGLDYGMAFRCKVK